MTAQIGARRTLKLTPEGFRGTKRPHPPHGRVRRRSPSRRRLRARRAPSGGLGASRAPRPRSQNQCATVAALESAAKEPLHLPFQPRGAQASLRAFLGTSAKSRRRAAAHKNVCVESIFFTLAPTLGPVTKPTTANRRPRPAAPRGAGPPDVKSSQSKIAISRPRRPAPAEILTWRPRIEPERSRR